MGLSRRRDRTSPPPGAAGPSSEPPAGPLEAHEALSALKIRLDTQVAPPEYERAGDAPELSRSVSEDLVAMLVLDLPGGVADVRSADAEAWGEPVSALWDRAEANTRAGEDLQRSETELPGGVVVTIVISDGPFAASGALWPELVAGPLGPVGALVAIPNNQTLAVHAIRHLGVVEGMRHLVPLVARRYAVGPGALSDQLFWSHGGELTRVGATVDGDWVSITPPAALVAALNELPAPGAATDEE